MKLGLGPTLFSGAFQPFFAAVLISAWFGGLGPGLLAAGLSVGIARSAFLSGAQTLASESTLAVLRIGLFVAIAAPIAAVAAALRRSRLELEQRVRGRTEELSQANTRLRAEAEARERMRETLRETEERFTRAFRDAPIGMALVGLDGRPLQVNQALCAMLGYTEAELLGKSVDDVTHPDDRSEAHARITQLLTNDGRSYTLEKRYLHKSGAIVWALLGVSLVRDAEGRPLYVVVQSQDVSARKHAQEALRRSEERYTLAVAGANDGLWDWDIETNVFYFSPRCVSLLAFEGVAPPDYVREWNRRLHPEDRQRVLDEINAHLDGLTSHYRSEHRFLQPDGTYRWLLARAAMVRSAAGTPARMAGSLTDVTERRQAEEALRRAHADLEARVAQRTAELRVANSALQAEVEQRQQAEERVQALNERLLNILESITDGFVALDRHGRFTYLNPRAEELLRRSQHALLGKRIWEEFPEAAELPIYREHQRVLSERQSVVTETYYPPLRRWFRVRVYPTQDGAAVLFEDITERHAREIAAISDILQTLNAALDVKEAFPQLGTGLRIIAGCDYCSLWILDAGGEWLNWWGLDAPPGMAGNGRHMRLADSPAAADILAGLPHVVADLGAELRTAAARAAYATGLRSRLSLPLRGRQQLLGMLTLDWRRPRGFNVAQLPLLNQIADTIALAVEKSRLFEEVRTARLRLEALSRRLLEVQESERRHTARELHDEIGQRLTGIKLVINAMERAPADLVSQRVHELYRLADDLLIRVRNLSLDLRPGMLDDLGLLPTLLWFFERYSSQSEVRVTFEHSGLGRRFSPEVETAAYRIVQEALTNVARHAGVNMVTVRAWADDAALRVQVTDGGGGFDTGGAAVDPATSGLAGMRERALLLGGQLNVDSAPGAGTRLSAELPLAPSVDWRAHAHQRSAG